MSSPSLRIGGIGAQVDVRLGGSRGDELRDHHTTAWSRCLTSVEGPEGEPLSLFLHDSDQDEDEVTERHETTLGSSDLEMLLTRTTQAVTTSLIGAQAGRLLMFHAGAVSHPVTGRSLVFIAEGGTGKTTLSRLLGEHYGYLSDETVAIDATNRILPYPKPLSVRTDRGGVKHELGPDQLGLNTPVADPTVARLILLDRYEDHTGAPEVSDLDLFDAIPALAPQTSSLHAMDRGLHRCADMIADTGPVLRVVYQEASSLLPLVADLIGAP